MITTTEQTNRIAEIESIAMSQPKTKLFIAIPIFWSVDPLFFQCCMRLSQEMQKHNIHGYIKFNIGDSAVGRARNVLTRQFLDSDATHMLMIDSDLVFGTEQIEKILSHPEPIVAGLYCKKQEGNSQLVLNSTDEHTRISDTGLMEVKYIGTGFIRVAREVFEKMAEVYRDEIQYVSDSDHKSVEHDFWQMGVYHYPDGSARWLSEDWYFCQRAKDLGYKIYADMSILLKHSGHATFPLSYQEKQLFNPDIDISDFQCPPDCSATINEVFGGQYDFGIKVDYTPRVLDIGANTGAFALWANSKWNAARVTCYEPHPELAPYIERNCSKYGVKVVNSAVGDPKRTKLFLGKGSMLANSQYKIGIQTDETIDVTVIPPSELPESDIIKIDAEGAEGYIVENLTKMPEYLIVEFHGKENRERVIKATSGKMVFIGEKKNREDYGVIAFRRLKGN